MESIDKKLENLRMEIELYGRPGLDTVYITDVLFSFDTKNFDIPSDADHMAAMIDFEWFLECSINGRVTAHPNPTKSFWVAHFGESAAPYGHRWKLDQLIKNLLQPDTERRAILVNPHDSKEPSCITSYHFQRVEYDRLDVSVSMRSSGVAKILRQDIAMTWLLLKYVARKIDVRTGKMTFFISNAHIHLEDTQWPIENDKSFGFTA